jgi:hypothetical protein
METKIGSLGSPQQNSDGALKTCDFLELFIRSSMTDETK